MRKIAFLRPHLIIIGICTIFAVLGILLACTWFRYQLNPDATSYFTIAFKYAHGDFRHAINGYWGPLLSWLLVPAVWLNTNLTSATKIIDTAAGVAMLITIYRFLLSRGVERLLANLTCGALAIFFVPWVSVEAVTPDLLLALLITWFALLLINFMDHPTRRTGLILGFIGALMYFAKGFGFFLFIGVMGLTALWQWRCDELKLTTVIRRYAPTAILFILLIVPFITATSIKYHRLTISNAGRYDQHVYGPSGGGGMPPLAYAGPLAPPNNSAVSAWEDPSYVTGIVMGWSPLHSWSEAGYFFSSILGHNINRAISAVFELGPLIAFGLVTLVLGSLQAKAHRREFSVFLFISTLMTAGYIPVLIETRYLWATAILGLMGAALWLSLVWRAGVLGYRQILVTGLIISFVLALSTAQFIIQHRDPDKAWYQNSLTLKPVLAPGSRIVSDDFNGALFACYYLRLQCYSALVPPADEAHAQAYYDRLKQLGVGYYVDYHLHTSSPALKRFTKTYFTKVNEHVANDVRITTYRLN